VLNKCRVQTESRVRSGCCCWIKRDSRIRTQEHIFVWGVSKNLIKHSCQERVKIQIKIKWSSLLISNTIQAHITPRNIIGLSSQNTEPFSGHHKFKKGYDYVCSISVSSSLLYEACIQKV